ncbi:hypothetical protein AwDysgo_21910 [Bacteroidales bacterium]|nr:hypothetical protein AwDysgo_21910 [Bacteroidales bacterium]
MTGAPTKNEDWTLEAGKTYSLRYRIIAYDGEMNDKRAEQMWKQYTAINGQGIMDNE